MLDTNTDQQEFSELRCDHQFRSYSLSKNVNCQFSYCSNLIASHCIFKYFSELLDVTDHFQILPQLGLMADPSKAKKIRFVKSPCIIQGAQMYNIVRHWAHTENPQIIIQCLGFINFDLSRFSVQVYLDTLYIRPLESHWLRLLKYIYIISKEYIYYDIFINLVEKVDGWLLLEEI